MTDSASPRSYSPFKKLLSYLKPHWLRVSIGIVALFVVNGIGVYLPLLIKKMVDSLQLSFDLTDIQFDVLLLIVLATIMWAIRMASRVLIFGAGRQAVSYTHLTLPTTSRV